MSIRTILLTILWQVPLALAATVGFAQEPIPADLGPRPFYLVGDLEDGDLKSALQACEAGPFYRSEFSIGHRGAPLQFPEHTRESYVAAARMGAGILECDVAFTKDRELVCRHSQCDLHTTTNILATGLAGKCSVPFTPADPQTGREASAQCCTSDLTLAEFQTLRGKMDSFDAGAETAEAYLGGTAAWRTDLYAQNGTLMTHAESIALFAEFGVKMTPELKSPEVAMPHEGSYTQEDYAAQMLQDYRDAGVAPANVYPQSFDLNDVWYWIENHPDFADRVVYLDGRDSDDSFDPMDLATLDPSMAELAERGLKIIAPPIWMLVTTDENGTIVPSAYATAAKDAGLEIIAWSLERSGPLAGGGGYYFQSVADAINRDGDVLEVLDVLATDVGVMGVFSDWPATTTFYANCMGLD
ncbi:glycerophosphodiester phosphodiesterase family protein [Rhizobium sp. EC-SD404]|uniref:glycerophosphodiester phosphodiesterase family protein n=1 Tax=Rhizobium sp. EC-SD404 TaxID=2038389 RepID=UPI00125523ED|nr:glycerophosphodiester phosphodiesterase family protein [Rhizobium sp. EC-SD404]VVT15774.1 Glycerophosphoryl diester phosphodiesterase [Rhizobium sp. EC-SD404]